MSILNTQLRMIGAGAGDRKRFSCVAELRAGKVDAALKVFGLDLAAEVELTVQILLSGESARRSSLISASLLTSCSRRDLASPPRCSSSDCIA